MGHKQIYSLGALPRDDVSVDGLHEDAVKVEDQRSHVDRL
jgi:hypothetical protein